MKISSLNKGLVGHWTMSQDSLQSATVLADKTPYENKGTIYGATFTTDRKGQPNSAMSFDGVNDYIDCGNDSSLQIRNYLTISVWIKPDNLTSATGGILCKSDFNGNFGDYEIHQSTNKIRFLLNNNSPSNVLTSNTSITTNWTHVVATYDGTTKKIYINGQLDNSDSFTGQINNSFTNLRIGSYYNAAYVFAGSIDDVRIYNRALSQAEITKLYESYNPSLKFYGGDYKIKSEGYIRVDKNVNNAIYFEDPESNLYGKTYFYVMKYQARNNGGVPQSTGTGLPWVNINQIDAKTAAQSIGEKYHLITNWEWMAIARDIESVKSNWTGGSIGSGMIKRGNVGIIDAGSYDGDNPETGILNDKAILKLSNGEEIYHFSGNVWEWVDAQIPTQADMKPTGKYWPGEIKDVTDWGNSLAYSEIGPKDNTFTMSNGVGGIYYDTNFTSNRAFLRGGYWSDGAGAGVFALALSYSPTNLSTYIGFRCARYGNE